MSKIQFTDFGTESMEIMRCVFHKMRCRDFQKAVDAYSKMYVNLDQCVLKTAVLTGMHPLAVQKIRENDDYVFDNQSIYRNVIRDQLTDFILHKHKLPTTRELFNSLYGKIPNHVDLRTFRKYLVLFDYVWKKIPGYTYVILERPAVTFESYDYLKRILEYAEQNLPIYYIGEFAVDQNDKYYTVVDDKADIDMNRVIYAVSQNEIIHEKINAFNEETFKNFLCHTLDHEIAKPSVIIFNNAEHHNEQFLVSNPTIFSLKSELTDWLDKNNVPYNDDMPKAQLLSLIKNCTDINDNVYIVDKILTANGNIVLRLPDHMCEFTLSNFVYDMKKNGPKIINEKGNTFIKSVTDKWNLPNCFKYIVTKMTNRLDIEMKIDEALDTIVQNMSKYDYSPVVDECDSDVPMMDDS